MTGRRSRGLLAGVLVPAMLVGCSSGGPASAPDAATSPEAGPVSAAANQPGEAVPDRAPTQRRTRPAREPRRSTLTIPALGVRSVPVVRYPGSPDDAAGTRIQNGGPAASPRGPGGGVGPGEVGNFIVTGHRTSHSAPFRDLPDLRRGDHVRVRSGHRLLVYRITDTRWTSFRSERSLARQSAAVPGRPAAVAVRPMITLSTCATPEDHAAGNFWSDRFGNPEHRIDKVGVLVRVRSSHG